VRSSTLQFYLDRAAQARNEAEAATLEHVRERCHRSEVAWMLQAEKARRSEQLRIEEQERKAATIASMTNAELVQEEHSADPRAEA
jgi:hypothetical protein